jgi:hypothetical protein
MTPTFHFPGSRLAGCVVEWRPLPPVIQAAAGLVGHRNFYAAGEAFKQSKVVTIRFLPGEVEFSDGEKALTCRHCRHADCFIFDDPGEVPGVPETVLPIKTRPPSMRHRKGPPVRPDQLPLFS